MKRKLKIINVEDNLAQMFLICEGLYSVITGLLLLAVDDAMRIGSVYILMSRLMSLDAWAMLLMLSGLILIASAFQVNRLKASSMMVGGLVSGILLMLYGLATFEVSVSYTMGMRHMVVGVFVLIISFLGARTLWIERRISNE